MQTKTRVRIAFRGNYCPNSQAYLRFFDSVDDAESFALRMDYDFERLEIVSVTDEYLRLHQLGD